MPDEQKLKTFMGYAFQCVDFIEPSKGLFELVKYFMTHSNPAIVGETFEFLREFQKKRKAGTAVLLNEVFIRFLLDKFQFSVMVFYD